MSGILQKNEVCRHGLWRNTASVTAMRRIPSIRRRRQCSGLAASAVTCFRSEYGASLRRRGSALAFKCTAGAQWRAQQRGARTAGANALPAMRRDRLGVRPSLRRSASPWVAALRPTRCADGTSNRIYHLRPARREQLIRALRTARLADGPCTIARRTGATLETQRRTLSAIRRQAWRQPQPERSCEPRTGMRTRPLMHSQTGKRPRRYTGLSRSPHAALFTLS